jgi:NADP-dependent 3-hydroxy acid dehydrogenase YdfG
MVGITAVRKSNAQYAANGQSGLIAVFAGATAGIGYATLQATATLLKNSTFYILGRSRSRFQVKLDHLQNIAPSCKFVFIETEVSLISSIDQACKRIAAVEEKIDYLCMSCGGIPFQGAVCKYRNADCDKQPEWFNRQPRHARRPRNMLRTFLLFSPSPGLESPPSA